MGGLDLDVDVGFCVEDEVGEIVVVDVSSDERSRGRGGEFDWCCCVVVFGVDDDY